VAVRQSSGLHQLLIVSLLAILDHHWRRPVQAEAQAGAGTGRQPPGSSRLHLATPADDERCSKPDVVHTDVGEMAIGCRADHLVTVSALIWPKDRRVREI